MRRLNDVGNMSLSKLETDQEDVSSRGGAIQVSRNSLSSMPCNWSLQLHRGHAQTDYSFVITLNPAGSADNSEEMRKQSVSGWSASAVHTAE